MPRLFRRAINAVKDQTSIGLAKLNANMGACNLDVAILKATSHEDDIPDERHLAEVVAMVASSTFAASACVRTLSRRICKTRDYVVALKSLILTFHALREGGSYFSIEAYELRVYPGCLPFLDLTNFATSATSSSSPWDYTAFVRAFARYLDTRLESAVEGKLRNLHFRGRMAVNLVTSMTPPVALVHMEHWQRLIARVIVMKPAGAACHNRLVQVSLYMVIRETFDIYRDISASMNLLLEKFFNLDRKSRIKTVEVCNVAVKQWVELDALYEYCIKIGVGRVSEYPCVQLVSKNLVSNLEVYLLDAHANSAETLPPDDLQNQPRFSLQVPVRSRRQSIDVISDSDSVMSEPMSAQKNRIFATRNEEKHPTHSALTLYDGRGETPTASNLPRWEHSLVETASQISNSENGSFHSQELKMVVDEHNRTFAEQYHNPLHKGSEKAIEKKAEAYKIGRNPTVRSGYASSSSARSSNVSATRQKLILQEQRRWREQRDDFVKVMPDD